MSYKTILFDLDGTLCDPGLSIVKSVQYALYRLGIDEPDLTALRRFVGPPLEHSFQEYYHLNSGQIADAVYYYREQYGTKGIKLYKVYPGIPELLDSLDSSGKTLGVVTSKPEKFTRIILENTGLINYFDIIGTRQLDKVVKKEVTMARVMDGLTPTQASSVVMVGDRRYDIEATKPFGIDSIGVLYGYGSEEELIRSNATHIAKDINELRRLLN